MGKTIDSGLTSGVPTNQVDRGGLPTVTDGGSKSAKSVEISSILSDGANEVVVAPRYVRMFHQVFSLPSEETLYATFHCTLSKTVGYSGKLFVSQHFITFHSSILTCPDLVVPLSSVSLVRKTTKSGGAKNSGITVYATDKKYVFWSFTEGRDVAYRVIEHLWKTNVPEGTRPTWNERSKDSSSSIDGDRSDSDKIDSSVSEGKTVLESPATPPEDLVAQKTENVLEIPSFGATDEFLGKLVNASPANRKQLHAKQLPTPITLPVIYHAIFKDDTFINDFHRLKESTNVEIGNWKTDHVLGFSRSLSYRTPTHASIGPKIASVEEQQRLYADSEHIVLECKTITKGIPLGDSFFVEVVYSAHYVAGAGGGRAVELRASMGVEFVKKSWFKGTIISASMKEGENSTKLWVDLADRHIQSFHSKNEKLKAKLSSKSPSSSPLSPSASSITTATTTAIPVGGIVASSFTASPLSISTSVDHEDLLKSAGMSPLSVPSSTTSLLGTPGTDLNPSDAGNIGNRDGGILSSLFQIPSLSSVLNFLKSPTFYFILLFLAVLYMMRTVSVMKARLNYLESASSASSPRGFDSPSNLMGSGGVGFRQGLEVHQVPQLEKVLDALEGLKVLLQSKPPAPMPMPPQ